MRVRLFRGEKRSPLIRIVNLVIFCTTFVGHAFRNRRDYDVIMVTSFPPVVMGVLARLVTAGAPTRYVMHYQDLWPDVATASGIMKDATPARLARAVDRSSANAAAAVVG